MATIYARDSLPDGGMEPSYLVTPKPSQMPDSIELALHSIGLELGTRLLLLVVCGPGAGLQQPQTARKGLNEKWCQFLTLSVRQSLGVLFEGVLHDLPLHEYRLPLSAR